MSLPSILRRKEISGRGRAFSRNICLHALASVAGRFKNTLLAGKFSKMPSADMIVPFTAEQGVRIWSSVIEAFIFHCPLVIERRQTAAIEASASPRKPSVVKFSKSVSLCILLVA